MLQIIALIKVKSEIDFVAFESKALNIIRKYNGKLISAFKPNNLISTLDVYDEIHILEFLDMKSFEAYQSDKELKSLMELKQKGTEMMDVVFSEKPVSYS
ncbi:DUF1330 domain-containing protein [Fibrobacterales bacterium]|nr:DUF1330 domain-containing protein [Fibrobacterales bacterium]